MGKVLRQVTRLIRPEPVMEGAGVHLRRSIGTRGLTNLDPFLLLDHFESSDPRDYAPGFPQHPHRGIETPPDGGIPVETIDCCFRKSSSRSLYLDWASCGKAVQ